MDSITRKNIIRTVFSPSSPIKDQDFFSGRIMQLQKIVDAINELGQHAILYGERGVGKTSLANIMCKSITNIYPVKVTCTRNDTFKSIWERVFNSVEHSETTEGIGFIPEKKKQIVKLAEVFSIKDNISPSDVVSLLSQLQAERYLFVFDEFDNIKNNKIRSQFSDLIKSLSDNTENVTIVIVGIADNVENLIMNHQSLERCLMQVKMPRMSDLELEDIIVKGFEKIEIEIKEDVKKKIVGLSSGFPHYTHLLCKYCATICLNNDSDVVTRKDLNAAIKHAIENTNEQFTISYRKAVISSTTKSQWADVLLACAQADCDEFEGFSTSEVLNKLKKITKKDNANITYNLGKFCQEEKGPILEKMGRNRNFRYKFINPMMKAYIKIKHEVI